MTIAVPGSRDRAMHEAYHAAGMLLLKMPPASVRTDFPGDLAGSCTVDWGDGANRDKAERLLLAVMLGGMAEGLAGWDSFPVDPEQVAPVARGDAENARYIARYLAYDAVDWSRALYRANRFTRDTSFRRLVVAIADELERVEVLDQADLLRIHAKTQEEPPWNT